MQEHPKVTNVRQQNMMHHVWGSSHACRHRRWYNLCPPTLTHAWTQACMYAYHPLR